MCRSASRGSRKTLGNFVKATFYALSHTYGFLSPDLWAETKYTKSPLQEFTGGWGGFGWVELLWLRHGVLWGGEGVESQGVLERQAPAPPAAQWLWGAGGAFSLAANTASAGVSLVVLLQTA